MLYLVCHKRLDIAYKIEAKATQVEQIKRKIIMAVPKP
jgi:hypothetical protein